MSLEIYHGGCHDYGDWDVITNAEKIVTSMVKLTVVYRFGSHE